MERILAECLLGNEADLAARLEAACQRFPEHAAELRGRVQLLAEMGLFGTTAEEPAAIPERLGGFRLLRRIGSGGMGVVYLAHEDALDRTVALKLVRPEHLYFPDSRARFEREVRAIAGLRHPGIVPVFSVGEAEGIPFFAMQHVVGANLQEVLGRLQGRPAERLAGRDLLAILVECAPGADLAAEPAERVFGHGWQEVCLRMVVQAAEALEHVHAQGVLHRDIKPSNLMVTPAGRVMLLDFGLSASTGSARITRSGAMAGSLPYMSPEQVRGGLTGVNARTDVYSLGVTLYELLTLVCPYLGTDAEDTRRRILVGEASPLREHNRAVTWDAETVCLKAMERDAARRYGSAAELARDLVRVLEYRPIEARRAGPVLRVRRLAQRRPAASVAVVLGSLVLLGGPVGFGVLERGAALRIEAQRQDAERNLGEALQAVHQMLTRVAGSRLRHVPQSHGVRRELLADALDFCRRLIASRPGHSGIRRETAEILVQASSVQRGLGDIAEAESSLAEAIALLEGLLAEGSSPRADLLELASAEQSLSGHHKQRGRFAEAEALARQALARSQELLRRDASDRGALRSLGESQATLAETLLHRNDGPGAQAAAQAATECLEACLALDPADTRAARVLVFALFSRGDVRVKGPTQSAEAALRRAVALARDLLARAPDNPEDLERLAVAESKLFLSLLQANDELAEAEPLARSAVEHRRKLATEFPAWLPFHSELGAALSNLAMVAMRQRRHEEALELHRQAIAAQSGALALDPEHAHALEHMHTHRANLARTLLALKRFDELRQLGLQTNEVLATTPGHHLLRADLLCTCLRASQTQSQLPAVAEAELAPQEEQLARRAVASLEAAVEAGFRDRSRLQSPGLAVLRSRADYRALLTRVRDQAESRPAR